MEVEVSDGRKLYRYRPESDRWLGSNGFNQFVISGFTSDGSDKKTYTVTFRLLNYYKKVIPGSETSVTFVHQYAGLPVSSDTINDPNNTLGSSAPPQTRFTVARGTGGGGVELTSRPRSYCIGAVLE
jgi:hypothetical protein